MKAHRVRMGPKQDWHSIGKLRNATVPCLGYEVRMVWWELLQVWAALTALLFAAHILPCWVSSVSHHSISPSGELRFWCFQHTGISTKSWAVPSQLCSLSNHWQRFVNARTSGNSVTWELMRSAKSMHHPWCLIKHCRWFSCTFKFKKCWLAG